MPHKSSDVGRHHVIEIGGTAHDANVGELRLRLTREIRQNACTQCLRRLLRTENPYLRHERARQYRRPALLRFELAGIKTGFLAHLALEVACKIDPRAINVASGNDAAGKIVPS